MEAGETKVGYRIVSGDTQKLPDVPAFIATLNESELAGFFEPEVDLFIARAPGRLDLMGGIADYSGSLVLQMPIAEATFAALQLDEVRDLTVTSLQDGKADRSFRLSLAQLEPGGSLEQYEQAQEHFQSTHQPWAAYVAGVFLVLMRERHVKFQKGSRILISSQVPEGKGVSSSAALEVAVMSAVAAAFDLKLNAKELALLCQQVEHKVVGAPCGVMDQMASACGEANRLLALLCQPAEVQGLIQLPRELKVWGLDSGIRHSVSGNDYTSVRTAAFMGHRIITETMAVESDNATGFDQTRRALNDPLEGYLANLTPSVFEAHYAARLPDKITGAEFRERYGETIDSVTRVDPARMYAVRQATAHPIYEHFRVRLFAELLQTAPSERRNESLGELMYQSHNSYSACGLGCAETDLLVQLVRKLGPQRGLYGAKITGGGSGGTVAVLARADAEAGVMNVVEAFERQTKKQCTVFAGSSPGSAAFGYLSLRRDR